MGYSIENEIENMKQEEKQSENPEGLSVHKIDVTKPFDE